MTFAIFLTACQLMVVDVEGKQIPQTVCWNQELVAPATVSSVPECEAYGELLALILAEEDILMRVDYCVEERKA